MWRLRHGRRPGTGWQHAGAEGCRAMQAFMTPVSRSPRPPSGRAAAPGTAKAAA